MSLIDSLTKLVERAQKQPRHIRVKILWLTVTVSMFFIVSLWVTSFKSTIPQVVSSSKLEIDKMKEEVGSDVPSLMSSLKDSLLGGLGSFFKEDESEKLEELSADEQSKATATSSKKLLDHSDDGVEIIFESNENQTSSQKESNDNQIKPVRLPLPE